MNPNSLVQSMSLIKSGIEPAKKKKGNTTKGKLDFLEYNVIITAYENNEPCKDQQRGSDEWQGVSDE